MEDKDKRYELTMAKIAKDYGKGTIFTMDGPSLDHPSISTGSVKLDICTGIGGIPQGRITEIYGQESSGKTTLALSIMSNAQKLGGRCCMIDVEHALNMKYARAVGLLDKLTDLSQPDTAEDALNIAIDLIKSQLFGVIVLDSVAALCPETEVENEDIGKQTIGLQARLMSQSLRIMNGIVSKTNTAMIFINQTRSKIGVMFGCFHYDTLVHFENGQSIPIGKVVDEKIQGNVFCLNEKTGKIEVRPIIDWHDNGKVRTKDDFIHFETESLKFHEDQSGGGRFGFTCTPDHEILTSCGWKKAKEINKTDKLISKILSTINGSYLQFLSGMLVGDSYISVRANSTASIRLQNNENELYMSWKIQKLAKFLNFKELPISAGKSYWSNYSTEFKLIKDKLGHREPKFFFDRYSDMGLALWFMDDAHFDKLKSHKRYILSVKRFKNQETKLNEIAQMFADKGIPVSCINYNSGTFFFNTEVSEEIARRICRFVPNCMQYKLPVEYQGRFEDFELVNSPEIKTEEVKILVIRSASDRQMRNKRKFDITVEGNHNYMVGGTTNGIIAHNSPETTSGGNALKFYASMRIDLRKASIIKENESIIGANTRAKIVKNKLAPPFRECEFPIIYGLGIDRIRDIFEFAVENEIVQAKGPWYKMGEENLGQGKETVMEKMISDDSLTAKILKSISEIGK